MNIALITCAQLPDGVDDDLPLLNAIRQEGVAAEFAVWDQPNDWQKYDALVLRSVWDYHERHNEFMDWMQQTSTVTRVFNALPVIQWNSNKTYLKDLEDFGITIAPTQWLDQGSHIGPADLDLNPNTDHYFLKPVIGADSSGTLKFANDSPGIKQAMTHLQTWLPKHSMMLQPYLASVESNGETSGMFFNGSYSHGTRKIPVKGDYRVQDTFGATDVFHDLNVAELSLSQAALSYLNDRFGQILYARFDFLQAEDGTTYLNEAELIEPSLFFNHSSEAALKFAKAITDFIQT